VQLSTGIRGVSHDPTIDGRSFISPDITHLFGHTIDRLYRAAMSVDSSPRNHIAYACYLVEHDRHAEAIHEFDEVLSSNVVSGDSEVLAEIVFHIARIQNKLADGEMHRTSKRELPKYWHEEGHDSGHDCAEEEPLDPDDEIGEGAWSHFEVASELAEFLRELMSGDLAHEDLTSLLEELDHRLIEKVCGLLKSLQRDRTSADPERSGLALLKLAIFFGSRNWCHVEVQCIRRAVRCFEQSAERRRRLRIHLLRERAAIVMPHP